MIVLGFDTSTPATAVALRVPDVGTREARDDPPAGAHPGHATRLLGLAHALLREHGLAWSELERIAVGVGPGTFTGLRVGVATARGLAQSLAAELVGVSSLEALALGAADASVRAEEGVLAVLDARRGEAFAAAFEIAQDGFPRELTGPRALPPQALAGLFATVEGRPHGGPPEAMHTDGHTHVGGAPSRAQAGRQQSRRAHPDGHRQAWLAIGDGAIRFRAQLEALGARVPAQDSPLHRVSAGAVCELACRAAPARLEDVLPDYRRRPDAELALRTSG